ncbi:MAG: TOPRIM nucleotidyl transferase/hydrolase domain-containing protein [Propionibacteriaceae bacterium]
MSGSLPHPDARADTLVLVEGESDSAAVEQLARLRGHDLVAESVAVIAMGGATNFAAHLAHYGPTGRGARLLGLVDAGEEHHFRSALGRAGVSCGTSRADLAKRGFGVCDADLEDELIRALDTETVLAIVASQGDGPTFARMRQQPAQRDRPLAHQLRRWFGSGSGRKIKYAPLLVSALDQSHTPDPLEQLISSLAPPVPE